MGDSAREGVDAGDGTDHAAVIDAGAGDVGAEADIVRQRDAARQMQCTRRIATRVVDRRHRDGVRGHTTEGVGVGDEDDAALDGRGAGPAGIVSGDGQCAVIDFLEGRGRCGREVKGGVEGERLAWIDFDDAGGRGVTELDLATADGEGQVIGDAEGGGGAGRIEDDLVAGQAELAVVRDGEGAAVDEDVAEEVIRGVAEREGTVASLGESVGSADLAVDA